MLFYASARSVRLSSLVEGRPPRSRAHRNAPLFFCAAASGCVAGTGVAAAAASHVPAAFKVLPVAGDGNCMFRALAQGHHFNKGGTAMDRDAEGIEAAVLRQRIVDEMQEQRGFLEYFLTVPWDLYMADMRRAGTWGGELELSVVPIVLQAPVHVYGPPKRRSARSSSAASQGLNIISKYGEDWEGKSAPVSVLFYGQHYDALIPISAAVEPEP